MAQIIVTHDPSPRYMRMGDRQPRHIVQVIGDIGGGTPGPPGDLTSVPPSGFYKVKNLYVNPDGKLVVVYEDVPVP